MATYIHSNIEDVFSLYAVSSTMSDRITQLPLCHWTVSRQNTIGVWGGLVTWLLFLCVESRQDSALNLTINGTNSINMSVELNGVVYTGTYMPGDTGSRDDCDWDSRNLNKVVCEWTFLSSLPAHFVRTFPPTCQNKSTQWYLDYSLC